MLRFRSSFKSLAEYLTLPFLFLCLNCSFQPYYIKPENGFVYIHKGVPVIDLSRSGINTLDKWVENPIGEEFVKNNFLVLLTIWFDQINKEFITPSVSESPLMENIDYIIKQRKEIKEEGELIIDEFHLKSFPPLYKRYKELLGKLTITINGFKIDVVNNFIIDWLSARVIVLLPKKENYTLQIHYDNLFKQIEFSFPSNQPLIKIDKPRTVITKDLSIGVYIKIERDKILTDYVSYPHHLLKCTQLSIDMDPIIRRHRCMSFQDGCIVPLDLEEIERRFRK